jgi:hypothetical protein
MDVQVRPQFYRVVVVLSFTPLRAEKASKLNRGSSDDRDYPNRQEKGKTTIKHATILQYTCAPRQTMHVTNNAGGKAPRLLSQNQGVLTSWNLYRIMGHNFWDGFEQSAWSVAVEGSLQPPLNLEIMNFGRADIAHTKRATGRFGEHTAAYLQIKTCSCDCDVALA